MTGPVEERPSAEGSPAGPPAGGPGDGAPVGGPGGGEPVGPGERRSGLRNPDKAVRGLGAGTLALEALVLLLAIQPIRVVGGHLSGAAVGAIVALAVACVVLAGQMKRSWAWHAGTVLQGLLMLSGLLHWSLLVLGVIFALVWAYALHVRRVILG
ncbi:DUF4233 domain-containing protein [Micromonospora sp. DR5-3]|uniref:DUF4233 domain-containing protein n=1 Tax=unclassified Micromonospora TaxID=2617518 RepID=UPI0011D802CB|nr:MULTISPECIES: DUF4233 domain-containing protein [unclassified Micromonospora]MCW3816857.1 DUF4233 domain-containing protein [Micromonospora sp. DR5-3]TYC23754.1 DUF4233 domain-containing protein [Micromonospora sp. MP36]